MKATQISVGLGILASIVFAASALVAEDCPFEPPVGGAWTMQQFMEVMAAEHSTEYTCCCMQNELGPPQLQGPIGPNPGCNYPPQGGKSCQQTYTVIFYDVTPTQSSDQYMPYGTQVTSVDKVKVIYECVCQNGAFRHYIDVVETVPIRASQCTDCPN